MQPKNRNRKKEVKCSILQERGELYAITFFILCFLFYVGALIKDTRPWKSTFDRLLPLLKELLERV